MQFGPPRICQQSRMDLLPAACVLLWEARGQGRAGLVVFGSRVAKAFLHVGDEERSKGVDVAHVYNRSLAREGRGSGKPWGGPKGMPPGLQGEQRWPAYRRGWQPSAWTTADWAPSQWPGCLPSSYFELHGRPPSSRIAAAQRVRNPRPCTQQFHEGARGESGEKGR